MNQKPNYEESILRLEEIVGQLESGELSLEDSMKLFEEGTKLSASCYEMLRKAEQKVTNINDIQAEEDEDDE